MSIAKILSDLTIHTQNEDIPASSYKAAKKMMLDTFGCAFIGMKAPGIEPLLSLERELAAAGSGTVFFYGDKLALPSAAYCNAAMIHALDFDNNYPGADIHILSIVLPAAFAYAEETSRNGQDVLGAIILGVEIASRIAKQYCRLKKQHQYFLTTSLVGGWGGVAAAARMLNLTVPETVNAFGIYYAQTCGNREALLEKKLTKRIQPAIAARAALYSVLLARKGFTGPEYTFEGQAGFFRLYTQDEPPNENVFSGLGNPWGIEELTVKKFPTCGIHHANILSAVYLKKKYGFAFADIAKVEFFLKEGGKTLVSLPFSISETPQIDAQFSAPYAIALALNKGAVEINDFSEDAILKDQNTIDLAARTHEIVHFEDMKLKHYQENESGYRYTKVFLKNGEILEHKHAGHDVYWKTTEEVEQKFKKCMTVHNDYYDNITIEKIIDKMNNFETIDNINDFIHEFCKSGAMITE